MCEEEYARVHRGLCDRRDARSRLRDDAAQRVGGSTGDDERRERSLRYLSFFGGNVADSFNVSTNGAWYNGTSTEICQ